MRKKDNFNLRAVVCLKEHFRTKVQENDRKIYRLQKRQTKAVQKEDYSKAHSLGTIIQFLIYKNKGYFEYLQRWKTHWTKEITKRLPRSEMEK